MKGFLMCLLYATCLGDGVRLVSFLPDWFTILLLIVACCAGMVFLSRSDE